MGMKTSELPFKITIAKPCTARWEDMGGSDQMRFCDHCHKNVYNLSAMTTEKATALLQEKNGNLCARIYQRADGTVLTEDCPVGVAQYWQRIKIFSVSTVTVLALATVNIAAASRRDPSGKHASDRLRVAFNDTVYKVKGWMGLNPKPVILMGMLPVRPLVTNAPQRLMGRVAVAAPKSPACAPTNATRQLMGEIAPQPPKKAATPAKSTSNK